MQNSIDVDFLVQKLESAVDLDRMLDGYVGSMVGWIRKVDVFERDGRQLKKVTWLGPDGRPGFVPNYTTSMDAALEFAQSLVPIDQWASAWQDGQGYAVINHHPRCVGLTPAMALCLSAIKASSSRPALK